MALIDYSYYENLHSKLAAWKYEHKSQSLIEAVSIMQQDERFLEMLRSDQTVAEAIKSEADLMDRAERFMYYLLFQRKYEECSVLIWGEEVFTPKPRFVELIWDGLRTHSLINVLGASSCSKSYSPIAFLLLDWVLDPDWTAILCIGPDSDHLSRNMWGDLARLHDASVIPLPGTIDTEALSRDKKKGMGFFTIALDRGEKESAKIKGAKIKPRDGPEHPIFGRNSRLRVMVDEAQQVPPNIFKQIINLTSNSGSVEHLKILLAANPSDEYSPYGKNCVPPGGFQSVQLDTEVWMSTTGWWCIRLNGMMCENVKQGQVVYKRLIDQAKIDMTIRACGGDDQHPDVWTFVYGMFPPTGALTTLVRNDWIRSSKGEWVFDQKVEIFAAVDVALQGGDQPAIAIGRVGRAVAWMDFDGVRHDLEKPREALQVDVVGILPKGDSQDLINEILSRVLDSGVKPENYAQDTTGNGQPIFDILVRQWADKIGKKPEPGDEYASVSAMGINYSYSPTSQKLAEEDTKTPADLFDRIATELWYGTAKFFEMDCIRLGRGVDSKVEEELAARRGGRPGQKGKKQTIESKETYKKRNGGISPDRADAFTMLVQVARIRRGLKPRAPETRENQPSQFRIDPWTKTAEEYVTRITGLDQETMTENYLSDTPSELDTSAY